MLKTKCIIGKPISKEDGIRISICSVHTLSDSITKHPKILKGITYNLWYRKLGPPKSLMGDYQQRDLPWKNYEERYMEYLRSPQIRESVKRLAKRSLEETITILSLENNSNFSHRRLLAEECKIYVPELKILIE